MVSWPDNRNKLNRFQPPGWTRLGLILISSGWLLLSNFGSGRLVASTEIELGDSNPSLTAEQKGVIIYRPVIVPQSGSSYQRVTLDFIAAGDDWSTVYLNGRPLFRTYNANRRQSISLPAGAYYLEFTGVVQSDCWARGYLDVGRNDSHVLVITFSKQGGVRVDGDPTAWIPDRGSPPSDRGVCYPYAR